MQNYSLEEEITVSYEDDHEAVQTELNALEVGRNSIRQRTYESCTTKVVTGRVRVFSRLPTKGRGDSGLGRDLTEFQDHWYEAQEGRPDMEQGLTDAEGLTMDMEELQAACLVEENLA